MTAVDGQRSGRGGNALIEGAEWHLDAVETPCVDVAYFEPRMRDRLGHFSALAEAYGSVCAQAGLSQGVFHHAAWQGETVPGWHRLFPVNDHFVGIGSPVDRQTLTAYRRYMAAIVSDALSHVNATLAVLPTTRFLTLPGITDSLAKAAHVRGAIIGVMETWPVPDCDDPGLVEYAFESAARILAQAGKPHLIIAESPPIAKWLVARGFSRECVHISPYPAAARYSAPSRREHGDGMIRCGAFGAMRPVQSPGLQANFLKAIPQRGRRWTVRMNLHVAADELGDSPAALEASLQSNEIVCLPPQLDQATYDGALASQDLMLLPYGERYNTIGSGIFLECLCAGVIPLVPAASTMGQLYLELGGAAPLIHRLDLDGIATCLSECEARLEELKQNALSVRETWLDHPMGPRQWQARIREKLLAW